MIIRTFCNSCLSAFEITLQPGEVDLVKSIVDDHNLCDCPRKCGGRISFTQDKTFQSMATDPRLREPLHLTGKELFKAIHGAGLPDEIPQDPTVVIALLKSCRIDKIMVEQENGHMYLHEIHLDNGTTIHLTAGPRGAQVLKITKDTAHAA